MKMNIGHSASQRHMAADAEASVYLNGQNRYVFLETVNVTPQPNDVDRAQLQRQYVPLRLSRRGQRSIRVTIRQPVLAHRTRPSLDPHQF